MTCLEKCDRIARSKPARIFYGILLVIICGIGIVRLLNASNQMQSDKEKQSRLQLLLPPIEGLIHFKNTKEDIKEWSTKLDESLAPYKVSNPNAQKCDYTGPPAAGKFCDIDLNVFAKCISLVGTSSACVFFKVQVDPSWSPQFLNVTDLPKELPEDLKGFIIHDENKRYQKTAWLSCEGENPADKENIGPISYFPTRGLPYYFINSEGVAPLLAVQFERPTKGILIFIKCRFWTKDSDDAVTFQLLLD